MHQQAQKITKKHQKQQKHKKHKNYKNTIEQKHKNANKRTKIKNALKKHLRGKSNLFAYLHFCACKGNKQKSLYNGNVVFTKLVKVLSALYKQKLFYLNPVKKQNYLNDSGATKLAKVCTPLHTFTSLVALVEKLNCLCETG